MRGNIFDSWRGRSPYYGETHEALAASVRTFIAREALPFVDRWEDDGVVPREFHRKAGEAGLLGLGFPEEFGGTSIGIDSFHKLVLVDETARSGSGGVQSGLFTHAVSMPLLIEHGDPALAREVAPRILSGDRILAIAVTEPSGGSDVAALKTRARREGDDFIVDGSKTFISNGMRADYFVTAVRTGGDGMGGISMLLIPAESSGLTRTPLRKMGWHSGDTATLHFDGVRVPARHLLGEENKGFRPILRNFNWERLQAAQQCASFARIAHEEAIEWAGQRITFGQKLGSHPVIRSKLADMQRQIDATQAWIDLCAWQYDHTLETAADLALLKVQATRMFEQVLREAAQVLGGASFVRGTLTERIYREVRVVAIGGGSEEILLDLAGRQLGFGT
ncbi:acyl-CoA dehydrogenase family protein [Sandaracinobacter sp. RS1-74]|uniref:acyl-CoA dehydrogenase family protein n=1 Tax=Sandaracinobacteroides sayramensis TaxID=2913411 RepID=UPI001EDBC47A|nr:acyl-CoA dehydrogenase family protein [Sandaracinobacteroides sayramensis]